MDRFTGKVVKHVVLLGCFMSAMAAVNGCDAASTQEQTDNKEKIERALSGGKKKKEIFIDGTKAWLSASSELEAGGGRYAVTNVFDGNENTAWVEGVEGPGIGESLQMDFEKPVVLEGIAIRPGYVKSGKVFTANAIPRAMKIEIDQHRVGDYVIGYDIEFVYNPTKNIEGFYHTDRRINLEAVRAVIFKHPIEARSIKLTITDSLMGSRYADMAITEWEPLIRNVGSRLVDSKVMAIIAGLRSREGSAKFIADDAVIEDLRHKYIHSDPFEKWIYTDKPPVDYSMSQFLQKSDVSFPYFARVSKSDRLEGESVFDRFLQYTETSLLDTTVVIDKTESGTQIIGSPSFVYGDSEWLELYPVIRVNHQFQIKSLVELPKRGGAPGVKHVIPQAILGR